MRSISYRYAYRVVLILLLVPTGSLTLSLPALAAPPEVVLHTFNSTGDGYQLNGGLIQGSDGNLYGTTYQGGPDGDGTVFQLTPSGTLTTLHSFNGIDGANPGASLVQGSNGNLYGTTLYGGTHSCGTVFQISTDGTAFRTLHSFNYSDGAYLYAGLIQGRNHKLYGTTPYGGISPQPDLNVEGTIFQLQTQLPLNPPLIASFAPARVPIGATVTVTGLNLANATSVTINGAAQTITSDDANRLQFTVATGTTTGPIVVTTANGSGSSLTNLVID